MKYTDNFSLKQPESTDAYNVDDFNENMSAVDAELKAHSDELAELYAPKYEIAQTLSEPESGERYIIFFGKIKKAIKDLIAHLSNKSNPHNVTASQVGLDKVPNVATNDQTPTYSESSSLTNLVSGEKLSVALGKIKKAIKDLIAHLSNKSNPHNVTASQVGLDKVPNVATNDQTPTYTESSSLTNLASGEKLSVAFGKIKKAIKDLIAHLSNKSNPHNVTASQVGAAAEKHAHEDYIKAITEYCPSGMNADDLNVPLALIPASTSENAELFNIIGSNFIYVLTLFYGKMSVDARRVQLAFNYSSSESRMAIRHMYASGWTPWKSVTNDLKNPLPINAGGTGATKASDVLKNLGLATEDISDSFLSQVVSGCTVNLKRVYKCGKVISGVIAFNYLPYDDEDIINPFVIAEAYRPKVDGIQVQSSLKKDGEFLFPNNITFINSGVVVIETFGNVYDSGIVSFSYICN